MIASVGRQKFKAHKVILSASSIFFNRTIGEKTHHPLIFMRGIRQENQLLYSFTQKKQRNKQRNLVKPFVKFITKIDLFGLNERGIDSILLRKQDQK